MSPRGIRARRTGVPERTIWPAAGTVVLAGAGVTAVSVTGGSGGTGCGTVFEGRAGGVDKPVRGAHTYGFNGYSAGVSLLGDYQNGGTPSAAAKQAIADLAAWKLNLHGVTPRAEVTLTAAGDTGVYETCEKATLHTVSGHRDGYATLCPGQALYDALPAIRTAAGASRFTTR